MPRFRRLLCLVCCGVSIATAEERDQWQSTALVDAATSGPAHLHGGDGDLTVGEYAAEARVVWQPRPGLRLGAGVGASAHDYESGWLDPAMQETATQAWVRMPATVMFSPHWGVTGLGSYGVGGDGATTLADDHQYLVDAGPLFVRDGDLIISVALAVSSRAHRPPTVFPLASLYWRFADAWRLTVIDEVENTSRLTYRFAPGFDAGILVDVRFFSYTIDAGPARETLLDERGLVAAELSWMPLGPSLAIRPFIGSVIARRLTIYDYQGDEVAQRSARPALLAGLRIRADL